jgi:hypothetical protein
MQTALALPDFKSALCAKLHSAPRTTSLRITIGANRAPYACTMKDETLWLIVPAIGCVALLAAIVLIIGR